MAGGFGRSTNNAVAAANPTTNPAGWVVDESMWRLRTPAGAYGNIPYKMVAITFDHEMVQATGAMVVLIQSKDWSNFLRQYLPMPEQHGAIYVPKYTYLEINKKATTYAVTKIKTKGFNEDFPIDPLHMDDPAPAGTYYPVLEMTLEFGTLPHVQVDPDDPETFLEIDSDTTGEFVYCPSDQAEMQDNDADGKPVGAPVPVRQPEVPHAVLCPQTGWNLIWRAIPLDNYQTELVPRLDELMGKVNEFGFPVLDKSGQRLKEIFLFAGYSYKPTCTWRSKPTGESAVVLVDLTMKIIEKKIIWNKQLHGHNSQWIPGKGWKRYIVEGKPIFDLTDFNALFSLLPNNP